MDNPLAQTWRGASLLRFVLPSIAMMGFMGLYTIVDTIFVAQFVNTDALSAINIVCPAINITVGLGTMLATGGNAILSREMGAGREQEAREDLTLLALTAAVIGTVLLAVGTLWCDDLLWAFGASRRLFPYCKAYLGTLLLFFPASMMQTLFSNLFAAAGRPGLGFGLTAAAGLANIFFDYLFIVPFGMGIQGAALGTGFGYLIPTIAGVLFFWKTKGPLSFARPKWKGAVLRESCLNGASEMVSQLAGAVTTFLFNITMLDLAGEDGVAAITILIYTQFLFHALYIGFSIGAAPVIGFQYGSKNRQQLKTILRICIRFIAAASLLLFLLFRLGGSFFVRLFAQEDTVVYQIAAEGFAWYAYSFLFCGWNIFVSALFTALSNGKISAILSFLRTFGLLSGGILLLPKWMGLPGVWLASPIAEGIMFLLSTAVCAHALTQERMSAQDSAETPSERERE